MDKEQLSPSAALHTYEVEFAPAVEYLLDTPIFYDQKRTDLLYEQPELINPEDLGMRRALGSAAIRYIAQYRGAMRAEARRRNPGLDIQEWNAGHRYPTTRLIGEAAACWKNEVRYLARQIALINTVEELLNDPVRMEELTADLRGNQALYFEDTLRSLRAAPHRVTIRAEDGSEKNRFLRGTSVIAPTGYGKTKLMGKIAKALGVGQPIRGIKNDQEPVRLLLMEPTIDLIDQVASATGDKTFENTAGIRPGRYFGPEKNSQSPLVAITSKMFLLDFKDGQLKLDKLDTGEEFDLLMIDETHELTAPELSRHVFDHWQGPIFGFTATPAYDTKYKSTRKDKDIFDVREILADVISHDDIVSCIDNGVLNGAQLFSIVVTGETGVEKVTRRSLDERVAEFLTPLLHEGRRGIIFCESGLQSQHAVEMAERLGKITFPDGRTVNAKAIGSFDSKSNKWIDAYHSGEVDVLTTVQKGSQGLNGAFDFVILNRKFGSLLNLMQCIGRGTRPSEEFPFTVYCQIFGANRHSWTEYRTIYEAFGLETIHQGIMRGPNPQQQNLVNMDTYSQEFRGLLEKVQHRTIGETLVMPDVPVEIPEGYIPLSEVIGDSGLRPLNARHKLQQAGFHWVGIRVETGQKLERYYEPAAKGYFDNPESAGFTNYTKGFRNIYVAVNDVAIQYGFGWTPMHRLVAEAGIRIIKSSHGRREASYILRRDLLKLRSYIDQEIPVAEPKEGSAESIEKELKHLAEEKGLDIDIRRMVFNTAHRRQMPSRRKRHHNGRGANLFYNEEDSDTLRKELRDKLSRPIAPPGAMSVRHIYAAAGLVGKNPASKYMSEEEIQQAEERWIRDAKETFMLLPTWTRGQALTIIERIKFERRTKRKKA